MNLVGLGATLKIPPPPRLQGGEVKAALSWEARRFGQGASVCRTEARKGVFGSLAMEGLASID